MNQQLDLANLPKHIAIIMDGNGRWAKKKGASRIFGHRNAVKAVRETTETCAELGVEYLTLYAFSTENWYRPKPEVEGLMSLLVSTIRQELKTLTENNVKLQSIGDITLLPVDCQIELHSAIEATKNHSGLTLNLALNYSGRWDIKEALKSLVTRVAKNELTVDDIDEAMISQSLSTKNMPDPELLIRTSGELRISNFLLWQLAYTELYISDELWPDFRKKHLIEAIASFQKRDRRFGRISEQVKSGL
ncbi:MAG: isoprenyl transferase [Bacteroidetes bacterium]|nr:isoprenyl transferase [Bacteroidota bacterium]MDA1119257.1 isoprenyl transferase [Bacteroidota bacterium]